MLCTIESLQPLPTGAGSADLNYRTVSGKLTSVWNSQPEKEALIFYDYEDQRKSLTNLEVRMLSEKCASLLRTQGVRKGDIVCNLLRNSLEREITNFGIILNGSVAMLGDSIVEFGDHFYDPIRQAKAKYVIVEPTDDSPGWELMRGDLEKSNADIERNTNPEMPEVEKVFLFRLEYRMKRESIAYGKQTKSAFDLLYAHDGHFVERVFSHDPAALFVAKCSLQKNYKLVLRTHSQVCQLAHRVEDMLRVSSEDIVYNDWALSWCPGLPFCYFSSGCTMVKSTLIECSFQKVVPETWELIEKEHCTMASLHPHMIQMLSSHCEDLPEPHWTLRVLTTTGLVRQSVMDAIGPCTSTLVVCYSLVEAGLVSRLTVTEETAARYSEGCVGDLTNPVRTKFDFAGTVKPTKIGEILLKGNMVCREYYNDFNLTRTAFTEEGFLMTGDLGFYDEVDRLYVLGRKADAIIRGDTAIFPRDIEEKVNQCPGIWKVKVVSIKDDKGIVQMCACVIPRSDDSLTIDRVKEFCRYQLGGTYDDDKNPHMPSYVFFFEDFPMMKGRVNRRMLAYMVSEIVHGNAIYEH